MRILFDIETNGLYETVDKIWIAVCKNLDTNEVVTFSDYDKDSKPLNEFTKYLSTATVLIGHNIIQYDLNVLHKILKWSPNKNVKLIDTMLISQLNNFRRDGKHSLKNFGVILKDAKGEKPTDWSCYTDEMKKYAIQDVNLNSKVYDFLLRESKELTTNRPIYKTALEMEHKMANICATQVRTKWKFNINLAEKHISFLKEEMAKIEKELNPTLKARKILIDKEPKLPKYAKDGNFTITTARMLSEFLNKEVKVTDIHLWDSKKPFQRHEIIPAELGNMQQVRLMLLEAGWKPTQFTPKGEPKITEDSLLSINSDAGKKVLKYYSLRSRLSVIEGWIELSKNNNGRVYVEAFNLGTPTFRQRHSKVVNVPSVGSFFGKEMRELFMSDDGKVMVGCDSSGNQIRALAHYLNNKQVNDHILNGDIHQHNANALGVDRSTSKSILYATIFGAGNAKVGRIITGKEDLFVGKEAREKLFNALPGLKELLKRLNSFFYSTQHQSGIGYIPALDGRKVFAESNFKLLNYLLQSYEAITVKNAVVNAFDMFEKENLEVDMLGLIHDEVQVQCDPKIANRVMEILKYSFGEFITKHLNLNIQMEGNPKIGRNWYETH